MEVDTNDAFLISYHIDEVRELQPVAEARVRLLLPDGALRVATK